MPVGRLLLGFSAATVLIGAAFFLIGPDALGPWGQAGLGVAGMVIVALFAPTYFGIDRESHRRR